MTSGAGSSTDALPDALPDATADSSPAGPSCIALTLINQTLLAVDLLFVSDGEAEEERSYLTLLPGETRKQYTFPEHRWRCRSLSDGALLATVSCGAIEALDVLLTNQAPDESSGLLDLQLTNRTDHAAEVLWIDEDSRAERNYGRAAAGESRTQQTFAGHTWLCRATDEMRLATVVLGSVGVHLSFGRAPSEPAAGPPSATEMQLDAPHTSSFYSQRIVVGETGLAIRAHAAVSPQAMASAEEVVRRMLEFTPAAVVERLVAARCTVAIIGREQLTSDVPEHSWLSGAQTGNWEYDATTRGVGGNPNVPVTSVGEENLLEDEPDPAEEADAAASSDDVQCVEVDMDDAAEEEAEGDAAADAAVEDVKPTGAAPDTVVGKTCPCVICGGEAPSPEVELRRRRRRDGFRDESILVHEFAHCVMDVGLDDDARARIRAAHARCVERGVVSGESYMGSNASEYWAESAQAWFEATVRCDVNCGLNTREELALCDPAIASELALAFGADGTWRYPQTLQRIAPARAAKWAEKAAERKRVRGAWWHVVRPVCMCLRVQEEARREAKAIASIGKGGGTTAGEHKQWREGQPLCGSCSQVMQAARQHWAAKKKSTTQEKQ